jgi:phage shock protein A
MSHIESTLAGYQEAVAEAGDDLREIDLQIAALKRNLEKLRDKKIEAQVRLSKHQEELRIASSRLVREEVTSREVEIAWMKGIRLNVGDKLTREVKALLRG